MNIYLVSAVQNLDAHIGALQEIRNQLASGIAAPVIGRDVFAPASAAGETPALPGVPVQTLGQGKVSEAEAAANTRKFQNHRRKQLQKQKRGVVESSKSLKAGEPVVLAAGTGERAKTLGGAMKLIAGAMGTFTREAVREALDKDYGDEEFVKNAGASTFAGNIGYWLKSGKLQENETGVLKVVDREFFGHVEFK